MSSGSGQEMEKVQKVQGVGSEFLGEGPVSVRHR